MMKLFTYYLTFLYRINLYLHEMTQVDTDREYNREYYFCIGVLMKHHNFLSISLLWEISNKFVTQLYIHYVCMNGLTTEMSE